MTFEELGNEPLANDIALPDVGIDDRFNGADGVEVWLSAIIPIAARVEYLKNAAAQAQNPDAPTISRFFVQPKAEEYSAAKNLQPVAVEFGLAWFVDFTGYGLISPPVAPPIVTNVTPLNVLTGEAVVISGFMLNQVVAVNCGGTNGTIDSKTQTSITFHFDSAVSGEVSVITDNTQVFTGLELTVTVLAPVIETTDPVIQIVGDPVAFTGTNLDLVTAVTIDGVEGTITTQTATLIEAEWSESCEGVPVFFHANGDVNGSDSVLIAEP